MQFLIALLLAASALAQNNAQALLIARPQSAGGGGGPTVVNSGGDYTGGGAYTTGWSPTNGNTLIVWSVAADATLTHTCSDGEGTGNTYTADGASVPSGGSVVGRLFHASNVSGSGTYVITCTGTSPLVAVIEISGNRTLDTASSGSNPSFAGINGGQTSCAPAAFTPTTAATALIDGLGSTTGVTITGLTQTDASYTTRSSALNGTTSFVGAQGSRIVAASASYSDGWSWTTSMTDTVCVNAAYK